ncbi:MAG: hypothetical protein H6Q90_6653 [Deltaproteobacteria bacterium]|nr:hypothetical protein [Deltaproteobacteria bacterium]
MRYLTCSLFLLGCAGQAPPGGNVGVEIDAAAEVDAAPPARVGQQVSGKAIDYFGNVAMPDAIVTTDGITPAIMATSAVDGVWVLDEVPIGSRVFLTVAHASYRATRNVATPVADAPVVQDAYLMSVADVLRQYVSLGKTPTAGTAFLAAEMQLPDGLPIVDIPLANVVLVDAANLPVPGVLGPVFFGAVGDVDPAVLTATAVAGKSRVAFLDLPPGTYTLKVTFPDASPRA